MKDQESNENWQLEEGNQVDDRWVLRESEQPLTGQWALNQTAEEDPIQDWQPVEYSREANRPERSGFAWILPVLITVFLLALIGYSGFILLPQIINPEASAPIAATEETPAPEDAGENPEEGAVGDVGDTGEEGDDASAPAGGQEDGGQEGGDGPVLDPSATPVAQAQPTAAADAEATAVPGDAPATGDLTTGEPATLEQDFATVITTYGVNARAQPDADADIVRILNQGESFFLFGSPAEGWLELLVTEESGEFVPGEPIDGQIAYAASEFFDIAEQPILENVYTDIMAFAGRLPQETAADDTPADDGADPDDTPASTVPTPTPGAAAPEPDTVTVRVDSAAGLNMRTTPDTTGEIIALLNEGSIVPALAISDDEQWIQVELDDGTEGWIFGEFVTVEGDLTALGAGPPPPAQEPTVIDATEVLTSGIVPPAPFSAIIPGDTPAVVIAVEVGAIARVEPADSAQELTLLPQGAALPAVSRTADGQWIEIELPEGGLNGWVARSVVSVTSDIDTLPIEGISLPGGDDPGGDNSGDETPILLPTPTPPGGDDAEATVPDTVPDTVPEATVRDILLAVYPTPDSSGESVAMLPRSTVVPVSGRNATSDWVRIETEEGDIGWVATRSVILTVEPESLAVVEP